MLKGSVTTVSTQALFLMNNPKIIALAKEQAQILLQRNKKMGRTMPKYYIVITSMKYF